MRIISRLIIIAILCGFFINIGLYIYAYRFSFTGKFNPVFAGHLYSESQYVVGERSKGGIGDDGLYAFAGYYYVFQKGDVTDVNFEHPPLGKYLIGLSILLFGNQNVVNIIYFLLILLVTYRISYYILRKHMLSLAVVTILSVDPLILDNLIISLLDLPFTLFFVTALYFFLLGLKEPQFYYPSMFFWGAAFSTRFFPFFAIIYLYLLLIIFLYRKNYLAVTIKASLFVPIVYVLVHISFFIHHPSLWEFIRHKVWMLSWFKGSPIIFANIWRNIFTAQYFDPAGRLVSNNNWTIYLPLMTFFSLTSIRKSFFKEKNLPLLTVYGLVVIYLVYISFFTNGVQKHLMPIYPLMIILAISNLLSLYSIMLAWRMKIWPKSRGK